jgi:hypothetical protein
MDADLQYLDGSPRSPWASQKRYISVYVMRADALSAHCERLADLDIGKACIRYRSLAAVDFTVVLSTLAVVAAIPRPCLLNASAAPNLRSLSTA